MDARTQTTKCYIQYTHILSVCQRFWNIDIKMYVTIGGHIIEKFHLNNFWHFDLFVVCVCARFVSVQDKNSSTDDDLSIDQTNQQWYGKNQFNLPFERDSVILNNSRSSLKPFWK